MYLYFVSEVEEKYCNLSTFVGSFLFHEKNRKLKQQTKNMAASSA